MRDRQKPAEQYVVIRHRPGYRLKWATVVIMLTLLSALGGYAGGVAHGRSGATSTDASNEELKRKVATLEADYRDAQQQLANLERGKIIDSQAQNQARKIIVDLETRISGLKSDLTFYKNIMAPSQASKGLQVDRFSLFSDQQPDMFGFKLVLTQVGNNKSYISGVVAVNVIGTRGDEKEVIALRDLSDEIENLGVRFRFRYFQDVEGELALPKGFEPLEVQVVAQAEGDKTSQAERTFNWDDLTEN